MLLLLLVGSRDGGCNQWLSRIRPHDTTTPSIIVGSGRSRSVGILFVIFQLYFSMHLFQCFQEIEKFVIVVVIGGDASEWFPFALQRYYCTLMRCTMSPLPAAAAIVSIVPPVIAAIIATVIIIFFLDNIDSIQFFELDGPILAEVKRSFVKCNDRGRNRGSAQHGD